RLRINSMTVRPVEGSGSRIISVDALLTSSGWTPSLHLFSQSRGKVAFDEATQRFLPGSYAQDCVSVGACAGADTLDQTMAEAFAAGEEAAKEARKGLAKSPPPLTPPHKGEGGAGLSESPSPLWGGVRGGGKPSATGEAWAGGMIGAAPGAGPDDK